MESNKRGSSVSFSKSDGPTVTDDHPSDCIDEEHVQLSMDPKLQTYLAQVSQESGCWGRFFPIPFERAAQRSWWDPSFDSEILEEQYRKSSYNYYKFKFRATLFYMLLLSIVWIIYYLVHGYLGQTPKWPKFCYFFVLIVAIMIFILTFTYSKEFERYNLRISLLVAIVLCFCSITFLILGPIKYEENKLVGDVSPTGHFSIAIEILLLIYTLLPLKLYISICIGICYSITFEIVTILTQNVSFDIRILFVRLLCHICIHLIGLHILVMTNVRMRNTFMKVGQSLLVRRQLEAEKRLKENMIHSLMPPSVASWLLNDDENFTRNGMEQRNSDSGANDLRSIFRPFNMSRMEKVSILFADIVGFTRMSSTKNAEDLVEILNNLFQRFDHLCKQNNCEKISTLGDCYYCVSGCPEPRPDHATCCVEMGLSMIAAIKNYREEKNENINMRVGVHTGTVLCGIVGTKRFKFDVWSNDVTFANKMESTGKPGMVHISEVTKNFLNDSYMLQEGEPVFGVKTYFILCKKDPNKSPSYKDSLRADGRQKYANSLKLFISPPPSTPNLSPMSRPRVLSCDTGYKHNPNMLSPDICKIKASSLPSILDSEGEDLETKIGDETENNDIIKTPTSTASSGKAGSKLRTWKIPKFLRKQDLVTKDPDDEPAYKQVPTIIEIPPSVTTNGKKKSSIIITKENDEISSNPSTCEPFIQNETIDCETIDVKSYISQSRSDIGQYDSQFLRTNSYRSQYSQYGARGHSPNDFSYLNRAGSNRSRRGKSPNFDILPTERTRSATVAVPHWELPPSALEVSSKLAQLDENFMQSANSRKDSGIRSFSRRSSLQQIDILPLNECQQRVSGYYTSSQSTVNTPQYSIRPQGLFYDKNGKCIQHLRKQSDRQLIKCVQDNSTSKSSYFIQPPLSNATLFFLDKTIEENYRSNVHALPELAEETIVTLANSRFNTYFDIFVSTVVFFIMAAALFLLHGGTKLWLCTFLSFVFVQICGLSLCLRPVMLFLERNCTCVSKFYRWNTFCGILVALPIVIVMINFCTKVIIPKESDYLYTLLLFMGIIHFCNFTQLNCWIKNALATICGVIFVSLFLSGSCPSSSDFKPLETFLAGDVPHSNYLYKSEIVIDLFLLLILVWLLNREFEIAYRLSFHANYVANRDKIHVQRLKNQADYLIYNIVPEHVAEQLKRNAKYSENFKNVGIIFATIVNFNEMYDESYLGGKEFLRVLNELIGDFDELLNRDEFQHVEKIKTIGSTFMAASGLNSNLRIRQGDQNEHLYSLMDFALEMQNVIDEFNRDLLEFNLVLRIGYNFGEVTAAVIGNTKLYYDIWGDAVNIASRMDSTGVNGCIQVGEHCLPVLEKKYDFKPRGSVFVKGKDNMNVYLLESKKHDQ